MAVTLESLPDELLDTIVGLAGPPPEDRSSEAYKQGIRIYQDISLTSRSLSTIGQSYLYRFIRTQDLGANIQPLLRTLSTQPVLASLVKEIHVRPSCGSPSPMSLDDVQLCWKAIEISLGTNYLFHAAETAFNRRKGCRVWEMIMLLALTTKIRTLVYFSDTSFQATSCANCPDMDRFARLLFSYTISTAPWNFVYSKLSDARVVAVRHRTPHSVVSTLLRLPTLDRFMGIGTRLSDTWLCSPRGSRIWDLNLQQCELDAVELAQVVDSCDRLTRISVVWRLGFGMDGRTIDSTALQASLQGHAVCLTKLVLEADPGERAHIRLFGSQDQSFGHGLQHFSRLESLYINEKLLLGSDWQARGLESIVKLPASLRHVAISTQRAMRDLPAIIQHVQSCLPDSLRRLSVIFGPGSETFQNCLRYFSREKRYRRRPALQWFIAPRKPTDAVAETPVTGYMFHCWQTDQSLKTPLLDVTRLADNGGGIDAVLEYLYPDDPRKTCYCVICSERRYLQRRALQGILNQPTMPILNMEA